MLVSSLYINQLQGLLVLLAISPQKY